MLEYVKRMVTEQTELAGKIKRLVNFIHSDKFNDLSSVKKNLLEEQLDAMKVYHNALSGRLELEKEEGNY